MMDSETKFWAKIGSVAAIILVAVIGFTMWIYPQYRVWAARMEGEAELAQAEGNRQIAVQEAQAKKEAASLLAEAEIERAKGVAKANEIIGNSLQNNEAYLRWLWIDRLDKGNNSVIYIPTETGLPILEAGKR
jgi:regulator of protease activity HflC (stomatin/prohibitin superfamily)